MPYTTTTVETRINRKIIVTNFGATVDLDVTDTRTVPDDGTRVYSLLTAGEAAKIGLALIGDPNATVVTDLPEAAIDSTYSHGKDVVRAGKLTRYVDADPDKLANAAKEYLAIAAFITKRNEDGEAAKVAEAAAVKAKEAANSKRRDDLASEFRGYESTYSESSHVFQKAIDRIIELEEAKASKPVFTL